MSSDDKSGITGYWVIERRDEHGNLIETGEGRNLVTQVGDQMYGERGAAIASPPAAPTGMKLGTGANTGGNAPSKTSTGAALATYLTGSDKAFDSSFPASSLNGSSRQIQYKVTYGAGVATTASPITEAVIVNDTLADATSTAANTIARIAVAGISAKGSSDTLTVTWNHELLGA